MRGDNSSPLPPGGRTVPSPVTWGLCSFALLLGTMCLARQAKGGVLHVPVEFGTIRSAVSFAQSGDTLLVGPGVYSENIDVGSKFLSILSTAGSMATVLDGNQLDTVIRFGGGCVLDGITIQNGRAAGNGGGIHVSGMETQNTIRNCLIVRNEAVGRNGGGVYLEGSVSFATIENNTIEANSSGDSGGGVCDEGGANVLRNNTIRGNTAGVCGGGLYIGNGGFVEGNIVADNVAVYFGAGICDFGSDLTSNTVARNSVVFPTVNGAGIHIISSSPRHPLVRKNIVALNRMGSGLSCYSSGIARIECNDIWMNEYGDYRLTGHFDTLGAASVSLNPLFCDSTAYEIRADSPCAPGGTTCGLIGARGVGCVDTPVRSATWGMIKLLFR